jgi:hypothetical protein
MVDVASAVSPARQLPFAMSAPMTTFEWQHLVYRVERLATGMSTVF